MSELKTVPLIENSCRSDTTSERVREVCVSESDVMLATIIFLLDY